MPPYGLFPVPESLSAHGILLCLKPWAWLTPLVPHLSETRLGVMRSLPGIRLRQSLLSGGPAFVVEKILGVFPSEVVPFPSPLVGSHGDVLGSSGDLAMMLPEVKAREGWGSPQPAAPQTSYLPARPHSASSNSSESPLSTAPAASAPSAALSRTSRNVPPLQVLCRVCLGTQVL